MLEHSVLNRAEYSVCDGPDGKKRVALGTSSFFLESEKREKFDWQGSTKSVLTL